MKTFASRDNPRFRQLRRWATQGRKRRADAVILLDGLHLIEACTAAGWPIDEVFVAEGADARGEIADWLAAHPSITASRFTAALFAEVAATESPSGILALAGQPVPQEPPDTAGDCLLLDGVQDPGNVGTLLRTAAAAGIRQALLGSGCADPWSPKSLRAGQGAQFELAIHENGDLPAFLASYRGSSLATRLDAAQSLWELSLSGPLAWVFGAEGQGVSPAVAAAAKLGVRIPMPGHIESLNVAAAAAICLFEAVRQRSVKK